jgi:hypothetical protein
MKAEISMANSPKAIPASSPKAQFYKNQKREQQVSLLFDLLTKDVEETFKSLTPVQRVKL